jgi:ABC-2 type transport system permease protein
MRAFVAMVRVELVLAMRRGETLLLTLGIPLGLLVFFSTVDVLPLPAGVDEPVDFLAPGLLALAILSTGMVQTSIGAAFERQYGVLKRLGVTPLGRPRLLAAKLTAVLAIELVQVLVIGATAVALGWDPTTAAGAALVAVALGTAAFGGLGLLMAGRLRGELTLAVANGLYIVLLLLGGMVFPLTELPGPMQEIAELLPAAALAEVLGAATTGVTADAQWWLVLVVWAVAAPVAAALTFRWE